MIEHSMQSLIGITMRYLGFMIFLINNVMIDYLDHVVVVFVDAVLIYSSNQKYHEKHLRQVLTRKQKLYARFSRCKF
jgi:hypothetical protein